MLFKYSYGFCFIVSLFFFSHMIPTLNKDNANSLDIFQFVSKTQRTELKFFSENFFGFDQSFFCNLYCGLARYCFPGFVFLKNVP